MGTMLGLFRKPAIVELPEVVRLSLAQGKEVAEGTSAGFRMVQERGLYSGRKVLYFRVFDPASLADQPRGYADLDAAAILYHGHIEAEGHVVLMR